MNECLEMDMQQPLISVIVPIYNVEKYVRKCLDSSKAGVVGRIAFDGKDIPLFYTPHGYSFLMENYKPTKRWLFHTIEALMAKRNCTTISCSPGEHQETLKLTKRATYVNNTVEMSNKYHAIYDAALKSSIK